MFIKYSLMMIFIFLSTTSILTGQSNKPDSLFIKFEMLFKNKEYDKSLEILEIIKKEVNTLKEGEETEQRTIKYNDKEFERLLRKVNSPVTLKIGKENIKIHFGENIIYVLKKYDNNNYFRDDEEKLIGLVLLFEHRGKLALKNKYLNILGETKIIKVRSSNNDIIMTEETGGHFTIYKPGDVILTVTVDKNSIDIPFRIIQIPLDEGMNEDKVIEILGMPDKTTDKYIDFNEIKTYDGISYYADDVYGESINHWIYNKYPKAVLRFGVMGVEDCVTPKWSGINLLRWILENK